MSLRIHRGVLIALAVVTAACGSGSGSASGGGAQGSQAAAANPGSAPAGACYVGTRPVRSITGHQPVDTPAGPARPSGSGGSLVLDLRADGRWTLSSDGSAPVTFEVGAYTATAGITGTVQGTYQVAGSQVAFHQNGSDGRIVLSTPAGSRDLPMSTLGPALAPGGAATISCGTDTVRLDSASVTMDLAGAPATAAAPPSTPATAAPAPPPATAPPAGGVTQPGAGTLMIRSSAADRTDACGGRSVLVQGSSNHLHLTGDCPKVEIVGSSNTVDVERVDSIFITGSYDNVTWHSAISRAQPSVSTSGVGDVVARA